MTHFIDLERRFHALTDAELAEPERLAALSKDEFSPSSGWSELLEYDRVLLLAEARAGKIIAASYTHT